MSQKHPAALAYRSTHKLNLGLLLLFNLSLPLVWLAPLPFVASVAIAQVSTEDRKAEADRLFQQGREQYQVSQFREALQSWQSALEIYREISDRAGEATTLNNIGIVNQVLGNYPTALDYYQQSLVISREIGVREAFPQESRATEAGTLNNIGNVNQLLGNYPTALDYYEQSLVIKREIGDRAGEAQTLNNIGNVNQLLGNYPSALDYYEQSLVIKREIGDRAGEAGTLGNIGIVNQLLGNYPSAIDFYQQSLVISRDISDRATEAATLNNIGEVNRLLGNYPSAIDYYEQSLVIKREMGNRAGEAATLNNIGIVNDLLGNYPSAIDYYEQSLAITRELGDRASESGTLNNIGIVNQLLGNYPSAIDYYQQSLVISREIGDRAGESNTLISIGSVNQLLGNYPSAIDYHQQSLVIKREIGDRAGESNALIGIGSVNQLLGNYPSAIDYYQQSLAITREIGDRAGESNALMGIGNVNRLLGNYPSALDYYEQSLVISREIGDRAGEALTLGNLGSLHRAQDQPELAIVFFKDAINSYETIRRDNLTLDQNLQESYTATVADTYRALADLLLEQGRILEAQQVLELLKLEELREFTRATYTTDGIQYDPLEETVVDSHGSLMALGAKIYACDPNCDQSLYDQQIALERQYDATVSTFEQTVRQNRAEDDVFYDPDSLGSDALNIVNAQPGTVLIYPVVLQDRLWLLWTSTGGVVGRVEVPVSQAEISGAVLRFRELLQAHDAQSDAEFKAVSQQLYGWLIGTLSTELEQNSIRHLVFAQDRTTRYLPMAALYDGSQFLIERYTVSTVLSAGLTNTSDRLGDVAASPTLGLGLTQPFPGYSALPNVAQELDNVVRTGDADSSGSYPGQVFLNDLFTFESLSQNVRRARILHIATHAEFVPGPQDASYLLLGNGDQLRISDIDAIESQLNNLHLVVLSACQTALGGAALDGTEIAGVSSYFLGPNKAEAVLATLWKVDDAGTSLLMQRFYELLATGQVTKAEALRQAQLSLLYGEATLDQRLTALGLDRGGFELVNAETVETSITHPYYWAPFVLIGNSL